MNYEPDVYYNKRKLFYLDDLNLKILDKLDIFPIRQAEDIVKRISIDLFF